MRTHDRNPDWLVDDRGKVWRREREFTCPNHPYGPADVDAPDALLEFARAAIEEINGMQIGNSDVCPDCRIDAARLEPLVAAASIELGLCCASHRWRGTGRLVEVGTFEQFVWSTMRQRTAEFVDSISGSIFLKELEGTPLHPSARVIAVIPLIRSDGDTEAGGT